MGISFQYIILWLMLLLLIFYIIRVIKGPSVWDRLLSMNLIATKIIVIIILFASIYNTAFILDFAIVYVLSGFIGVIFIAFLLHKRTALKKKNAEDLQASLSQEDSF